jgi:hypothetical protein
MNALIIKVYCSNNYLASYAGDGDRNAQISLCTMEGIFTVSTEIEMAWQLS